MQITAALVKELRERTGAGMMECKKALVECSGEIEAAIELMRKSGLAKAAKKAGRIAAEGVILVAQEPDAQRAAIVEINCETDFVTKADDFKEFANAVAQLVLAGGPVDLDALMASPMDGKGGESVEEKRQQLVSKIGENITVRRFKLIESAGTLGVYLHGTRIGVLVDMEGPDSALVKDIAMHIAASRPICVTEDQVPKEILDKESEILTAQADQSGKPKEIIARMVEGRLKKFFAEVTLVGQPFVRDPDLSVGKLLKDAEVSVKDFVRFEVGEGIEKKTENFAEEVMAQTKGG